MFVVTWGSSEPMSASYVAVVEDDGGLVEGGGAGLRAALSEPITRDAPDEVIERLRPGEKEHTRAALESLPNAVVTEA